MTYNYIHTYFHTGFNEKVKVEIGAESDGIFHLILQATPSVPKKLGSFVFLWNFRIIADDCKFEWLIKKYSCLATQREYLEKWLAWNIVIDSAKHHNFYSESKGVPWRLQCRLSIDETQ